jgi:hypothetical protein
MEGTEVGNAVDASMCGFSRRSLSPGQPRFPEYATQQGYLLTFDKYWKLHFNAPFCHSYKERVGATLVLLLGW